MTPTKSVMYTSASIATPDSLVTSGDWMMVLSKSYRKVESIESFCTATRELLGSALGVVDADIVGAAAIAEDVGLLHCSIS